MDESQCILAAQQGDLDAFNNLVETYQRQVYSLAFRMLGSSAAAEDAAQDAFISSFKNIRAFRGGSFKSWLLRIAANACYDQMRSSKRHGGSSLDVMLENPLVVAVPAGKQRAQQCSNDCPVQYTLLPRAK